MLARDVALFRDAVTEPPVQEPLIALLALYLALGTLPATVQAWHDAEGDEGVPLDRNVRPVLNKPRRPTHMTGREHVAHQGPHHGGGG